MIFHSYVSLPEGMLLRVRLLVGSYGCCFVALICNDRDLYHQPDSKDQFKPLLDGVSMAWFKGKFTEKTDIVYQI